MALFGAPKIDKLEAKGNVKGLLRALTHEQPSIRVAAAQALGRLKASEAVGPLISALLDRDVAVAVVAAQALGAIGDVAAVQALTMVLSTPPQERRIAALHSLGQIGGEPALDGIVSALQVEDASLDEQAALALAQAGPAHLARLLHLLDDAAPRLHNAALRALRAMGQPCVAALADLTAGKDGAQTEKATAALGAMATPEALRVLVNMLSTASYSLREKAQATLVAAGVAAIAPLVAALEGQDQNAQRAAIQALGETGLEEAAPALAAVAQNGPKPLARAAVQALAQLKVDAAMPTLTAALESDDWLVRQHAAQGLAALWPSPVSIAGLLGLLYDGNAAVRKEAVQALEKLGWEPSAPDCAAFYATKQDWEHIPALGGEAVPALERLIPLLSSGDRSLAVNALAAIGPAAYGALSGLLSSADTGTRAAAAQGLGKLGNLDALPALLAELARNDSSSGAAAATALGELQATTTVSALETAARNGSALVRSAAVQSLARLGEPGATALLALSHAEGLHVAKSSLAGLAMLRSEEAVERILELTGDAREEVQREAIRVATGLGDAVLGPAGNRLRRGDEATRALMAELLGSVRGPGAEGPLLRALWHPDESTRLAAARALEMLGAPQLAAGFDPPRVKMVYTLTFARQEPSIAVRRWLEGEALRDLADANPTLDGLHARLASDAGLLCGDSAVVGPFGHNLISMVAWFKAWLLARHVAIPAWDGWFYHREITIEEDAPCTAAVLIYYQPGA
jgi:HEAT repeat protein